MKVLLASGVAAADRAIGRLFAIDRSFYLFYGASLVLLLSGFMPWYRVPSSVRSTVDSGGHLFLAETMSGFELAYRIGVVLVALTFFYFGPSVLATVARYRRLVWFSLLACGLLPAFIAQWEPEAFMDSRILYFELDRAVQDMEANMNHQQTQWRMFQRFNPLIHVNANATYAPLDDDMGIDMFTLRKQDVLFQHVLGLSNPFLEMVCKGWILAIVALIALVCALYPMAPHPWRALRADFGWSFCMGLLLASTVFVPRVIGNHFMQRGDAHAASGDYVAALDSWREAERWKPTLSNAFPYVAKLGTIARKQACGTCPETYISEALDSLEEGRDAGKALLRLERGLSYGGHPGMRFFMNRVLIEGGINAFNAGQFALSKELFERALVHVPINPMAWYGLGVLEIRHREYQRASMYFDNVVRLQSYQTFKRLTPRGQVYVAQAWDAYARQDYAAAHDFYSKWLTPETW